MKLILKRKWEAYDASNGEMKMTMIPEGEHEVEIIPNPAGFPGNWIVLKGTQIGASEDSWRIWKNGKILDNPDHPNHGKPIDRGEYEVVIEE